MDIGEVVKQSGIPASTLRFYEEKKLIQPQGRHGLRRQYGARILEQLELISLGQTAGFSLDEIRSMLTMDRPNIDRELLLRKADELDSKLKTLAAIRDGLRHAAACTAPRHLECPTFQRLMKISKRYRTRSINLREL